eukprot:scaffold15669_cov160-Amphora_coffeaeformis.AAC.6
MYRKHSCTAMGINPGSLVVPVMLLRPDDGCRLDRIFAPNNTHPRTRLSIGQDGRMIPIDGSVYQVLDGSIKDILGLCSRPIHLIERVGMRPALNEIGLWTLSNGGISHAFPSHDIAIFGVGRMRSFKETPSFALMIAATARKSTVRTATAAGSACRPASRG